MSLSKITVQAAISSDAKTVWNLYTTPEHITQWNFAHPSWHCPTASNDMRIGGRYIARMEAKDGSFGFDFDAIYTAIEPHVSFTYTFGGREATVIFKEEHQQTIVTISFDPETENPIEMQRDGWQAILDNFKKYTESLS
jgi:uncharacterized protein YndB with AHSA1/START domain